MADDLEVDLYVAEEGGLRTDLRDNIHLVQFVFSTAFLPAEEAAAILAMSKKGGVVRATLKEADGDEESRKREH